MATEHHARLLLRINEAADQLAVGRSTIYELVDAGELPVIHIGRAVRIPAEAIQGWVERQQGAVPPRTSVVPDGTD